MDLKRNQIFHIPAIIPIHTNFFQAIVSHIVDRKNKNISIGIRSFSDLFKQFIFGFSAFAFSAGEGD